MSLKSQLKVMVVDDMATSRRLVTMALDELGIENYTWAGSGQDALKSLAANPVHLVLTDYNMPNGSGIDLLRAIREYAPIARTGVIIITGSPDQRVLQAGSTLGLNNYIKKPFTTLQLKQCIEKVTGPL